MRSEKKSVKAGTKNEFARQRPAEKSMRDTSSEENEDNYFACEPSFDDCKELAKTNDCGVRKPYIYSARLVKF